MFTGIIETLGTVRAIAQERSNLHFTLESPISHALRVDQSVSHDGACLTVVEVQGGLHRVTAVEETLRRTQLADWQLGSQVNLERCLAVGGRLDGHLVQGHVDAVGECVAVEDRDGSWRLSFRYAPTPEHLLVDKGSVCVNGVSLTVVEPAGDLFSVAIIPYTWQHTNFRHLRAGHRVNLEFDIIGKYIARQMAAYGAAFLAK